MTPLIPIRYFSTLEYRALLLPRLNFACVYQITNSINGHYYIGCSRQPVLRMLNHLAKLRIGKHSSRLLQKEYNEFGADVFGWEFIQKFPSKISYRILYKAEREAIAALNPFYNTAFKPLQIQKSIAA